MESNVVQRQRDALELCVKGMCMYCEAEGRLHRLPPCGKGCEKKRLAEEALSLHLRNCDVGTPEEQVDRFILFCDENHCFTEDFRGWECSESCPVRRMMEDKCGKITGHCELAWANLPYESEEK